MWEFEQHTGTTQLKALNLLLEANAGPQAKQKRVGHFPGKMDLIMNFREKLKKISPHHLQRKQQKTKQKKHTNKHKTKTQQEKQKKNNNKQSKLRIVNQYTGTHKVLVTSKAQG